MSLPDDIRTRHMVDAAQKAVVFAAGRPEEGPPPSNPDPDIVAFLEGGRKDPKEVWRATAPKRD